MLIWRESQLFSHYTPFFRKQLGDQQNENCKLLFLSSSICVGYLTHRLVHFRIRVNGPEDNGVYQKHKALVTLEPWLSGSTYSIIVTTSCICSWVRVVVNWFTRLFFARKSIISSSKRRRQKSNRVLRFFGLDGVYVKSQWFFRFCYDFCLSKWELQKEQIWYLHFFFRFSVELFKKK